MSEPVVAKKGAYKVELGAGEYWWCSCGYSKTQPFCDGAHVGSGLEPMSFTLTERQNVSLCGCKCSKTRPFCDGAHKELV